MSNSKKQKKIIDNINELKSFDGGRLAKYQRSIQLYESTPNISLTNIKSASTVGWYSNQYSQYADTTQDLSLNIIKSCIDTLQSKIASQKVRPFFNTIKGSYKDVKRAKTAQQYFDVTFDEMNVNKEVSEAFRNACIFDTGVLYIDGKVGKISSILPWQVFIRPAEATYGKITRVYYERKDFPTVLLDDYKGDEEYVNFGVYYDIVNHVYTEVINNRVTKTEEYDKDVLPFVFLHYNNPVKGNSSSSITDMLTPIQIEINVLMSKVKDASQLNPANTIFIPEGTGLSAHKLNNGIGNIIQYRASANMTGSPVTVATPPFIDGQYQALIDSLTQKAMDLVGLSELSVAGQKPTGLDSGKALSSMENIESARFETQLNSVIRAYVDLSRVCIALFNGQVLPNDKSRTPVTWEEVRESVANFAIQYSGQNAFSKDPSTKEDQVIGLWSKGLLRPDLVATILDIPDTEKAYSVLNNSYNTCQTIIDNCIDYNVYDVPFFVPFNSLKSEIVNTLLQLYSADAFGNKDDINKLIKLFEVVVANAKKLEKTQKEIVNRQVAELQNEQAAQATAQQTAINNAALQSER